jgi:hypothetical protein
VHAPDFELISISGEMWAQRLSFAFLRRFQKGWGEESVRESERNLQMFPAEIVIPSLHSVFIQDIERAALRKRY